MTAQLRSELLKLRTTRTVALLLLAAAGLTLFGACIEGLSPTRAELMTEETQRSLLGAGITAVLFATFAGLIAVTSEFRYGTIRPTLLVEPRRRVVLGARSSPRPRSTGLVFAVVCVGARVRRRPLILLARPRRRRRADGRRAPRRRRRHRSRERARRMAGRRGRHADPQPGRRDRRAGRRTRSRSTPYSSRRPRRRALPARQGGRRARRTARRAPPRPRSGRRGADGLDARVRRRGEPAQRAQRRLNASASFACNRLLTVEDRVIAMPPRRGEPAVGTTTTASASRPPVAFCLQQAARDLSRAAATTRRSPSAEQRLAHARGVPSCPRRERLRRTGASDRR